MKIYSWDGNLINDVTNYEAFESASFYGLPTVGAAMAGRGKVWPLVGGLGRDSGRMLYFDIFIRGGSSAELAEWFDYESEEPKKLICSDDGGLTNPREVLAVCTGFREVEDSGGMQYTVSMAVHGDILWRGSIADDDGINLTASGQTKVFTNSGDAPAYPLIQIVPTSAKSTDYAYKIWVPVRWRVTSAYNSYPVDITNDSWDTATLVSGSKMQADGDDLRVWVDGVEVDRWLDGINTASTKVWVNLDFQARAQATLGTAIASTGEITTIVASTSISGFPDSGIVIIDSEAFTYTSKSNGAKTLYGVTRAMRGTSMAAHTTTDTIWWVQHDIWILYGHASAAAPTVDDDYKPIFTLSSSTNTSWDYDEFGEDDGLRTGAWSYHEIYPGSSYTEKYTANRGTDADPWSEIGLFINNSSFYADPVISWELLNPCGITNANFQNGEKYASNIDYYDARIQSYVGSTWTLEDTIAAPSADDTWESWSDNEALTSGAKGIRLYITTNHDYTYHYLECSDVTLTLNSTYTPTITLGGEQNNYSLDATITNNTTGEAIKITFPMAIDTVLDIDTDNKTVTWNADDSNQFQALDILGDPRLHWLALQPGNNTIQYDDTGTTAVTLSLHWRERFYD